MRIKRNRYIAGFLSLIVPGLGQIYRGKSKKGAIILTAAIIIGNLNIIILPLISIANPVLPPVCDNLRAVWAYWIPRVAHDIFALWSIVFWLWAVVDAILIPTKKIKNSITAKMNNYRGF
jgi:TM2 domain-containing membrane protein YozV